VFALEHFSEDLKGREQTQGTNQRNGPRSSRVHPDPERFEHEGFPDGEHRLLSEKTLLLRCAHRRARRPGEGERSR
jgi:hypothetical protein